MRLSRYCSHRLNTIDCYVLRMSAACLGLVLVALQAAEADVVIMKDGFILEGKITDEKAVIVDAGQLFYTKKLTGMYMIDDGARIIGFNVKQVQDVDDKPASQASEAVRFINQSFRRADKFAVPPGVYADITPFDAKWNRIMTIANPNGKRKIEQTLTVLTPHYLRIDARHYNWTPYYLTAEMDPRAIREIIYNHAEMKMKGDKEDVTKKFQAVNFFIQAGWFDLAGNELDFIQKDHPDQKEKVEARRDSLKKLVGARYFELIEKAHKAGRHGWAQGRITRFPTDGFDQALQVRVRALQSTYETARNNIAQAQKLLASLQSQIKDAELRPFLQEAADLIQRELDPDNVARLEPFLSLAPQFERDREKGKQPTNTPEELISLAITGWLQGGGSAAEAKVETARRLWLARQFLLQYQETHDPAVRQRLASSFQSRTANALDELATLIRYLPPSMPYRGLESGIWPVGALPLPYGTISLAWTTVQSQLPGAVYELQCNLPWSQKRGPSYQVQLPAEYHAGRRYPVLFALHTFGEKPDAMIKRWGPLAAQHGYLLVAPSWERGLRDGYNYTPEEQAAVVDVLRDVRRRFQIDSDRVFLTGFAEGANMAFDVGLSHPDLFAGVVPIGGMPKFFAKSYWRNAQYLPFYVVDGELNGDSSNANRAQFQNWMPKGYPAIYVSYKGRGQEWFDAELRYIFDWMGRKKRVHPLPDLGHAAVNAAFGEEFQSMRSTDNSFYWLSAEDIASRNVNDARRWNKNSGAATMQARVSDKNQINVNIHGFKRATVWLAMGMVDFERPLNVYLNSRLVLNNRKVAPSLNTLLEDFYQRGDNQRVYVAKVELAP